MPKLAPYKKEFDYSYALGVFPTLELLGARPYGVQRVLVSDKIKDSVGLAKIKAVCAEYNIPLEPTKPEHMQRLSRTENCFAVGVFKKTDSQLEPDQTHLVLVNPDDMGNLGAIMRTSIGFGVHNLAIIRPAADVYNPKTIRASMGAMFRLYIQHFDSFDAYRQDFPAHNLYPFVLDGAHQLAGVTFTEPSSLIFGNEGAGLPHNITTLGVPVSIEQESSVDSLNLALAVGLALYKRYTTSE